MRTLRPSASRSLFRYSPIVAALACAFAVQEAGAQTYIWTVTNTGDNGGVNPAPFAGTGTLRQAIINANANCGVDPGPIIEFNLGAGPYVISPSAPFPQFTCVVPYTSTVDGGSSQTNP